MNNLKIVDNPTFELQDASKFIITKFGNNKFYVEDFLRKFENEFNKISIINIKISDNKDQKEYFSNLLDGITFNYKINSNIIKYQALIEGQNYFDKDETLSAFKKNILIVEKITFLAIITTYNDPFKFSLSSLKNYITDQLYIKDYHLKLVFDILLKDYFEVKDEKIRLFKLSTEHLVFINRAVHKYTKINEDKYHNFLKSYLFNEIVFKICTHENLKLKSRNIDLLHLKTFSEKTNMLNDIENKLKSIENDIKILTNAKVKNYLKVNKYEAAFRGSYEFLNNEIINDTNEISNTFFKQIKENSSSSKEGKNKRVSNDESNYLDRLVIHKICSFLKKKKEISLNEIEAYLNKSIVKIDINVIDKLIKNEGKDIIGFKPYKNKYYLKSDSVKKRFDNNYINRNTNTQVLVDFKNIFKSFYVFFESGNKEIDYIIKCIVKDNVITLNEELFLKAKLRELNQDESIIDILKEKVNENNPYLDNLIKIIFSDDKVSEEELVFLKEKTEENNLTKVNVNKRFWSIGFNQNLKVFKNNQHFKKLVKLFYLCKYIGFSKIKDSNYLFNKLSIFYSNDIEKNLKYSVNSIEEEIKLFLENEYDCEPTNVFSDLYNKVTLLVEDTHTKKEDVVKENNEELQSDFEEKLYKILKQEKMRIGSPAADLLAENIKFRFKKKLWD